LTRRDGMAMYPAGEVLRDTADMGGEVRMRSSMRSACLIVRINSG